jgi:hypothetical protein
MHIRQLARNAALITVAVIVTAGFSTGIARATSAAPTSTVSASSVAASSVVHSGTAPRVPERMYGCDLYRFCALGFTEAGGYWIIQEFGCGTDDIIYAHAGVKVWLMINRCTAHPVYYYLNNGGAGCVNPSSQKGRSGGWPAMHYYYAATWNVC